MLTKEQPIPTCASQAWQFVLLFFLDTKLNMTQSSPSEPQVNPSEPSAWLLLLLLSLTDAMKCGRNGSPQSQPGIRTFLCPRTSNSTDCLALQEDRLHRDSKDAPETKPTLSPSYPKMQLITHSGYHQIPFPESYH